MKKLKDLLNESVEIGKVYSNPYAKSFVKENEDEESSEMTTEQKHAFLEAVKAYKSFGETVYRNEGLSEVYESIRGLVEAAGKNMVKETEGSFDGITVSRHVKRMNESFKIFEKTLKEVSTLQQRLESSYDEIGETLGKYYEINETDDSEIEEGNEFGAARAKAIAAGSDSFEVDGKTYPLKGVDKDDKENAKEFANESMNEGASTEEKRIVMLAVRKIAKYRGVPIDQSVVDVQRAAEELERDIKKGKVKESKESMNLTDILKEAKDVGHYERVGNQTIVDSNFVNYSKGVLPNSELVHLGMGDFAIKSPKGMIKFQRSGKLDGIGQDFVGRPHRMTDDKNGKLVELFLKLMLKKKKAILSMSESVNEVTKYKVGQKTPVGKIVGTSVWGKGRKQEWFYDIQKPGYSPVQYSEKSLDKIMGESVNEASEEFVVYVEKDNGRKKLLHTKQSQRAANMFLTKNADKILNQSGIRTIGSMSKFHWEKDEAQYAENIKKTDMKTVTKKEWDKAHKDYKGMIKDQPYMMYMDKKGTTVYGPVNIKESVVNEAASRTAMEIGGLTGMNKDAIQKFVDSNELDIEKVYQFVKKGKLKDRMDLVSAIAGKPNNPIQKKMIKMFGESVVNEAKYDIGMARKGNGITIYNKAEEENGDYKNVAHIDNKGKVKYLDKKVPSNIKKEIEAEAQKMKESVNEGNSMIKLKNLLNESFGFGELPSSKLMKMKVSAKDMLASVKNKKVNESEEDESVTEARVSAKKLLQSVVDGQTDRVEGIKLSKEMAEAYLNWLRMSPFGKKYGKLPFNKLFTASFRWGLHRHADEKSKEYKDLKAKAKGLDKK